MNTKPLCEYCEGTGRVEFDAVDMRGEHRSESGPCECVEDDVDSEADNAIDAIDLESNVPAKEHYDWRMSVMGGLQ